MDKKIVRHCPISIVLALILALILVLVLLKPPRSWMQFLIIAYAIVRIFRYLETRGFR